MTSFRFEDKFIEPRGSIYTIYDKRNFPGIDFVQDKISESKFGVIRGFHGDNHTYKLISCLRGSIILVLLGIDNLDKHVYYLNGDDSCHNSILVPPKYLNAHQCISTDCIFHYKWSDYYTCPEDQWSVHYNDETIDPPWYKIPPIVSDRDKNAPTLKEFLNETVDNFS